MNRLTLPPAALVLGLALPLSALAAPEAVSTPRAVEPANDYASAPAILFVNFEATTIAVSCPVAGNSSGNAALNCAGPLTGDIPAWGDATTQTEVLDALDVALMPYDIRVTTERPDPWVPYYMLMFSDDPVLIDMSMNQTCTLSGGINCDARARNRIGVVVGEIQDMMTMEPTCMMPDMVAAALRVVGAFGGLEGSAVVGDPMLYPPDWMTRATTYQDMCGAVMTATMQACPTEHGMYCMDDDAQQNSHQELLGVWGSRPEEADAAAPTIADVEPADGATFPADTTVVMDATIEDDSAHVAVKWTLESDALIGAPFLEDGKFTACTNRVCDQAFEEKGIFPKLATDDPATSWDVSLALPGGEYTLTLEAQDMAGNAAEPVTVTFTVEGASDDGGGETGSGSTTATTSTTSTSSTSSSTGGEDTGESSGGDEGGEDEEKSGCSCTADATGVVVPALLLLPLGFRRRRR